MIWPFNKDVSLLLCAVLVLSGCESALLDRSAAKPVPDLKFIHLSPYVVNGGATSITQSFVTDAQTAAITKEIGESPASIITRYARQRFETNMPSKTFRFNIKNAQLRKSSGATDGLSFMTGLSEDQYMLEVFLELSKILDDGSQAAPHTVFYKQVLTMSSNNSIHDKELGFFKFYEDMMVDIDRAVSDIVQNKL